MKKVKRILIWSGGILFTMTLFAHVVYEKKLRPGVAFCQGNEPTAIRGTPTIKGSYIKIWDDEEKAFVYTNIPCIVVYK